MARCVTNRPCSYLTGTSMPWRLMRGKQFGSEKIPPHRPQFGVRSSAAVRILIWSMDLLQYNSFMQWPNAVISCLCSSVGNTRLSLK